MRVTIGWSGAVLVALAAFVSPVQAQDTKQAKETPAEPQQVTTKVNGRVVDESGKPVEGALVAGRWHGGTIGGLTPYQPVKTSADGSFTTELTFYYGRPIVLANFDKERNRGGLVLVEPKAADASITIKLGPLVHVHGKFECKELAKPVGWTNTMLFAMPGRINFVNCQSQESQVDFWLPPGTYALTAYGSSDVARHKRDLTVEAGKPELDLGSIDLPASKIAKLKGKAAPTLLSTDARGVSKGTQISDFKGKWVVLEFWGYWCGPCVGGAIPRLTEIYDDHEDEREKFVVLSVHAPDTKTFAELDERVKPVVRDTWAGRMMPFPILMDADGKIQETFDVTHWPTSLLFDPDGKLVGEVQPDVLESKLRAIPLNVALARKLDRNANVYFDNPTLTEALAILKRSTRTELELDRDSLDSLSLSESTKVPLTLAGQISLRSAFDLLFTPLNLAAEIGPKGYVIKRKPAGESIAEATLSRMQETCGLRRPNGSSKNPGIAMTSTKRRLQRWRSSSSSRAWKTSSSTPTVG